MKENSCPECGKMTNTAMSVDGDDKPSDGDISLCFYCGAINQFDSKLNIVNMPDEVLESIKKDEPETYKTLIDAVIMIKGK